MRRMLSFTIAALMVLALGAAPVFAEMMPIEPGTVKTYDSPNKKFQARISYGGIGVFLSLHEGDRTVWSTISERPGMVAVSDNGSHVVLTTFGWEDEGGSDGFAVFGANGEEKQFRFNRFDNSKAAMKWVDVLSISPDGNRVAVLQGLKEGSEITVYSAVTGEPIWYLEDGDDEPVDVSWGPAGELLVATRDGEEGMMFLLVDEAGDVLARRKMEKNFSYDVAAYGRFNGEGLPEIFELESGKFISFQTE